MQKYNILELNEKLLPELQTIAEELGIKKISSLKKDELIYRILDEQAISYAGIQAEKAKEKEAKKAERQTKAKKAKATAKTKVTKSETTDQATAQETSSVEETTVSVPTTEVKTQPERKKRARIEKKEKVAAVAAPASDAEKVAALPKPVEENTVAVVKVEDEKEPAQTVDVPEQVAEQKPAPETKAPEGKGHEYILYQATAKMSEYAVDEKNVLPLFYYLPEENEKIATYSVTIDTYVGESIARFISGDLDLDSDWNTYIEELNSFGLQDYIDTIQTGYDRWLANAR